MRPGHRRIFPIKIQKAREEIDKLQAKQKREEMQQKSKQEMEDELAKIEMSKKLERARQKRGNLDTSIAGEVENKEDSMAHDTTASTDIPSDKLHHAFISHKKTHTAFGDHYEMLSIRLKVKWLWLTNCTSTSAPYHLLHEGHAQVAGVQRFYGL